MFLFDNKDLEKIPADSSTYLIAKSYQALCEGFEDGDQILEYELTSTQNGYEVTASMRPSNDYSEENKVIIGEYISHSPVSAIVDLSSKIADVEDPFSNFMTEGDHYIDQMLKEIVDNHKVSIRREKDELYLIVSISDERTGRMYETIQMSGELRSSVFRMSETLKDADKRIPRGHNRRSE